jgi:hypothetical protein
MSKELMFVLTQKEQYKYGQTKLLFNIKASVTHGYHGPGVDSASNRNEYQESSWG